MKIGLAKLLVGICLSNKEKIGKGKENFENKLNSLSEPFGLFVMTLEILRINNFSGQSL